MSTLMCGFCRSNSSFICCRTFSLSPEAEKLVNLTVTVSGCAGLLSAGWAAPGDGEDEGDGEPSDDCPPLEQAVSAMASASRHTASIFQYLSIPFILIPPCAILRFLASGMSDNPKLRGRKFLVAHLRIGMLCRVPRVPALSALRTAA